MTLLGTLKRERGLYARCRACDADFRLVDADLFDATRALSPRAAEHLTNLNAELKEQRRELTEARLRVQLRSETGATAANVGKIVEKIVPSLPGFGLVTEDCRPLFEPIDYIVFHGLVETGCVSALTFIDVKTGRGALSRSQREVRAAIERGEVSLLVADTTPEEPKL